MIRSTLPVLLAVLCSRLASCGGGGSSFQADAGTLDLVIGTDASNGTAVSFLVDGVVLEDTQGRQTTNLLRETREVVLVDALGRPEVITLHDVPQGEYRLAHFAVHPASGMARRANGQIERVVVPSLVFDISTHMTPVSKGSGRTLWRAEHAGRIELPAAQGGSVLWTPVIQFAGAGDDVTLRHTRAQITRIDPQAFTMAALLGVLELPVQLVFPETVALIDTGVTGTVDRQTFFAAVQPREVISISGELHGDGTVTVTHAQRGSAGNTALGKVESIDRLAETFEMTVLEVKSGAQVPGAAAGPVLFDASQALIRFHGMQGPLGPLDLSFVEAGYLVSVTWEEPAVQGDPLVALRISIEHESGAPTKGRVTATDTNLGTMDLTQRHGVPMVVAGSVMNNATVEVMATSLLYRQSPQNPILLQDVTTDDRIHVRGFVTQGGIFRIFYGRVQKEGGL